MRFAGWSGASTAGRRTLPEDRLPVHRTGGEAMVEGVGELGVAVGEVGEGGVPLGTGLPAHLGQADAGVGGADRLRTQHRPPPSPSPPARIPPAPRPPRPAP